MSGPSLETIVGIAIEAGREILRFYEPGGQEARAKVDGSPVTAADEAAEAIILQRLAEHDTRPVIAEESVAAGRIPQIAGEFWLVDPLDGTKEFVSGSGEFTVNIALVRDGAPVLGVVCAPAVAVVYAGDEAGAWTAGMDGDGRIERRAIRVSAPGKRLRVVASKSHLTDETRAFIDRFAVESFVSSGSSLKFCRIAEAAADLYPRLGRTMEWDTAAGHAVLRAAGGAVYTLDGKALRYGKTQTDTGPFANPHFVAAGGFDPLASGLSDDEDVA